MRAILITVLMSFVSSSAAAQTLVTCGVNGFEHPLVWADTAVHNLLGCTQQQADDAWKHFHMADGEWDRYGLHEDACNYNTPLGRTLKGITLLRNASSSPNCEGTGSPLDWAYCYSSELIVKLVARCEDTTDEGDAAARTFTWGIDQWNERTELYSWFYYNFGPPVRAATLYHEARHAEDDCTHTSNCMSGKESCDPQFEHGCVGGNGKGAYAWTAIWLHRYAVEAHAGAINQDLREYAVAFANAVLGSNFDVTPCFVYDPKTGHVDETGCP